MNKKIKDDKITIYNECDLRYWLSSKLSHPFTYRVIPKVLRRFGFKHRIQDCEAYNKLIKNGKFKTESERNKILDKLQNLRQWTFNNIPFDENLRKNPTKELLEIFNQWFTEYCDKLFNLEGNQ